jgi:hypothetical protein
MKMKTTIRTCGDTEKTILRAKFIPMCAYIKNTQLNDLVLYLKLLEKQEQAKPKTIRRREMLWYMYMFKSTSLLAWWTAADLPMV